MIIHQFLLLPNRRYTGEATLPEMNTQGSETIFPFTLLTDSAGNVANFQSRFATEMFGSFMTKEEMFAAFHILNIADAETNVEPARKVNLGALHFAIHQSDLASVKSLAIPALLEKPDKDGWLPIHHAVEFQNDPEIVETLLEAGANVDSQDNKGWTPLHYAVIRRKRGLLEFLLTRRPLLNLQSNTDRISPLYLAVMENNPEFAELLLKSGAKPGLAAKDDMTALHIAVVKRNADMVRLLLRHRANVNAVEINGATPLHGAAFQDLAEIVQILLDHDADRNVRDRNGWTPCDVAKRLNKTRVLALLCG